MASSKFQDSNVPCTEVFESVLEMHLMQTSEKIISEFQHNGQETSEKINEMVHSVNYCTDVTVDLKDVVVDSMHVMTDQNRKIQARSDHFEGMTFRLRGIMGAKERKRRRADQAAITRLEASESRLIRQLQVKDKEYIEMIETLSDRMEEMLCQMDDLRIENKANQEKILALLTARL